MSRLWQRSGRLLKQLVRVGKARVFQNLGWLTGGQLVGDFASFIFFVLLSRNFGPEGVGVYAFGVAVATIGRTIVSLGVDDFGIRELATRESDKAEVVGKILGTQCWLLAAYAAGCGLFLIVAGVSTETLIVTGLLTAYHLSAGLSRSSFLPAFAERRMAAPALLNAGTRVLAIVVGIGVILFGGESLAGVLLGFPAFGVLLLLSALWLGWRDLGQIHLDLDISSVFAVAKRAWPFAAGEVVFRLHSRADVLMLSLIAGSAATGIYAAGLKFVEVSMMIVALFSFAFYPKLTKLAESDAAGFGIATRTLVKGGFAACVVLGWGIFVFVPDLIPVFFGSEFRDTEWVVKLFALLVPVKGLVILGDRLMLAAGRQHQKLRFQTMATGLNIVFNGVLIPLLAVGGAIIASVVSIGINSFLLVQYLQHYSGERLGRRLVVEVFPLLAVGILAAGITAFLGAGEMWAAAAFMVSFTGAAVISGFSIMIWGNMTRLVALDE